MESPSVSLLRLKRLIFVYPESEQSENWCKSQLDACDKRRNKGTGDFACAVYVRAIICMIMYAYHKDFCVSL